MEKMGEEQIDIDKLVNNLIQIIYDIVEKRRRMNYRDLKTLIDKDRITIVLDETHYCLWAKFRQIKNENE